MIGTQIGSTSWKSSETIVSQGKTKFLKDTNSGNVSKGETVDQWVNELRLLLSSCDYEEQKWTNLRDIIVVGVADMRVKERLLRESGLTLAKALDIYVMQQKRVRFK